jgi:hypothetical protein
LLEDSEADEVFVFVSVGRGVLRLVHELPVCGIVNSHAKTLCTFRLESWQNVYVPLWVKLTFVHFLPHLVFGICWPALIWTGVGIRRVESSDCILDGVGSGRF